MDIKKVEGGWEYAGIVFEDKRSALGVKKSTERSKRKKTPTSSKKKPAFKLIYDSEHPTSFGAFVTEYLRKNEMTIVAFAEDLGVSKQTIFNWINAESVPSSRHSQFIIKKTGCSVKKLFLALEDNFERQKMKWLDDIKKLA